ncbi:hypothetical protein BH24CHL1_BH24CHL1_08350 [soil metagenome]
MGTTQHSQLAGEVLKLNTGVGTVEEWLVAAKGIRVCSTSEGYFEREPLQRDSRHDWGYDLGNVGEWRVSLSVLVGLPTDLPAAHTDGAG